MSLSLELEGMLSGTITLALASDSLIKHFIKKSYNTNAITLCHFDLYEASMSVTTSCLYCLRETGDTSSIMRKYLLVWSDIRTQVLI